MLDLFSGMEYTVDRVFRISFPDRSGQVREADSRNGALKWKKPLSCKSQRLFRSASIQIPRANSWWMQRKEERISYYVDLSRACFS